MRGQVAVPPHAEPTQNQGVDPLSACCHSTDRKRAEGGTTETFTLDGVTQHLNEEVAFKERGER